MLLRPIIRLVPTRLASHNITCPVQKKKDLPCEEPPTDCSKAGDGKGDGKAAGGGDAPPGAPGIKKLDFQRATYSGKVRLGFLPDEWFTFFHNITGVTGGYLFFFNITNYVVSKEIYVMEHEYYLGLSALVMVLYAYQNIGPSIASYLDKEVDAVVVAMEKGRKDEIAHFENVIKMAKEAQVRAEGQKLLMDAKKENVAMQLEAVYRERAMMVYRAVRGRMDYHIKRYQTEARIHQRWMILWILRNVRSSITPEFEKQALDSAIQELASVASRAK